MPARPAQLQEFLLGSSGTCPTSCPEAIRSLYLQCTRWHNPVVLDPNASLQRAFDPAS